MLPTRHRIFSSHDQQWHEFVGDEAAIRILGQDVFLYGPKVIREVRELVKPESDTPKTGQRVIEREGEDLGGHAPGDWHIVKGDDKTEDKSVTQEGMLHDGLEGLEDGVRTLHMTI